MNDIYIMMLKEFWEFEYSFKKLLIAIGFILLPTACIYEATVTNGVRSLLPINQICLFAPIIVSIGISSQLSLDSILSEKKAKTLESLLSTNLSRYAIIIGKTIPPASIGFLISVLSSFLLKILFPSAIYNYFIIVFSVIFAYLSSCITILGTMLIKDEKIAPFMSIMPMILILFFVFKFGYINHILLSLSIFIFISILLTLASIYVIDKVKLISSL